MSLLTPAYARLVRVAAFCFLEGTELFPVFCYFAPFGAHFREAAVTRLVTRGARKVRVPESPSFGENPGKPQ
jgi:hypothetical protein